MNVLKALILAALAVGLFLFSSWLSNLGAGVNDILSVLMIVAAIGCGTAALWVLGFRG